MTENAFKKCEAFCDGYLVFDLGWTKDQEGRRILYEGPEECIEIRYATYELKKKREAYDEP